MGEWIEWGGGYCPIPRQQVQIRYRSGEEIILSLDTMDDEDWRHEANDPHGDIIAYRIVTPSTLPADAEKR